MPDRKTAIVTGGAQGIGKAIAMQFLKEGKAVIIADNDDEAGRETLHELRESGIIYFIPTDVSDENSVMELIDKTVTLSKRIDILVNNAAILNNKPLSELSAGEWKAVVGVNLTGPFLCVKYAMEQLKRNKGVVINMASTRALQSEANTEAYSASKGGIVALTHALAVSLGPDIRVNCISPGWIETRDWKKKSVRQKAGLSRSDHEQHPVGRVGKPEDIASLVSYLCSDESGFISGANFVVDGGMTRKMIYQE